MSPIADRLLPNGTGWTHAMYYCLLPIAYCLLPIAWCPLPIAHCLLPIAWCPLPIAHCLLPIAYCLSPTANKVSNSPSMGFQVSIHGFPSRYPLVSKSVARFPSLGFQVGAWFPSLSFQVACLPPWGGAARTAMGHRRCRGAWGCPRGMGWGPPEPQWATAAP